MVLLECERARRDDLVTRLSRYKLRAKVTLGPIDTLVVGVAWGDGATSALETAEAPGTVKERGDGVLYTDPRLPGAGVRFALRPEQMEGLTLTAATPEAYDVHRVSLGLPDGSRDMEVDKALLLENGFEELRGVDFQKGCYIGQELTARTHYRALIKKRLMPVAIDGATPAPGDALTLDGRDAGEMKSVSGAHGLALVRLEAWTDGGNLTAGSARITPRKPDWMQLPKEQ
jgi:folate-binding protein YgfZ